jgi:hypothetical protein
VKEGTIFLPRLDIIVRFKNDNKVPEPLSKSVILNLTVFMLDISLAVINAI